ncbi:MAG TPA: SDR family oxidoreductase [Amycolatopsis sp.]|jgi:NAD(P)-dependent dehydrogenase (short-subunit alcohol dehydrogenase family)
MTTQRTALVTGANKGIGKAIAAGLVKEGFTVYVGARDVGRGQATAAEIGGRFMQLDVTAQEDVDRAVREIGHLDVLVNNAGVNTGDYGPPSSETAEAMRRVYETNVFAVVRVTNAFLPLLRASTAGRIVNVTSKRGSIGEEGAWAGQPSMPYSSSKTALNAITAHYARELAGTAVKVNGAAPGHVATDFNGFRGRRTPEEGAEVAIRLATLDADGPTGQVFEDETRLAW